MAKRAAIKAERRAEREAAERAEQRRARRRRVARYAAAAIAAAVVIAVALIMISTAGSGGPVEGAAEAEALVAGIEQHGTVLGDRKAAVRITEFADLQCPACRRFAESEYESIIAALVRPGTASFEIRQFTILGSDSEFAASAAWAAAKRDRYFEFVDLFYRNQGAERSGYVTEKFLDDLLVAAGVPASAWSPGDDAGAVEAWLRQTDDDAARLGLTGTPGLVVSGPGGEQLVAEPSADAVEAAVAAVR